MSLETRLLGALLDTRQTAELVAGLVIGDEFVNPVLGVIFDQVMMLRSRGIAVDAMTLTSHYPDWEVHAAELTDPISWSEYDTPFHAIELASAIRTAALRRAGASALSLGLADVRDAGVEPMTALSTARSRIDALIDAGQENAEEPVKLRVVLERDSSYDWLVPDLLERRDRLVVTGPEGSGKTMLMRQLAVCASAGLHPLRLTHHDPIRVLVVDVENTEQQWQRTTGSLAVRAAALGRRDPRDHLDLLCRGRLNLTNARDEALVHRWVDRCKPDMLVIGPLYKLVPKGITNDDDAAPLIAVLDGFRDRGLTLVMEAHAGKATDSSGDRDMRPRGSSALLGWPEFGFGIRPLDTDPTMSAVVKWRGDRDQRTWPRHLMRGGQLPWTPAS